MKQDVLSKIWQIKSKRHIGELIKYSRQENASCNNTSLENRRLIMRDNLDACVALGNATTLIIIIFYILKLEFLRQPTPN